MITEISAVEEFTTALPDYVRFIARSLRRRGEKTQTPRRKDGD